MAAETDWESDLDETNENQHPVSFDSQKKLPAIDFSESHKRARFNFERICQKYEKMKESGIEIDLHKDVVYAPKDMTLPKYKKNIDKFANFTMSFGSSSAGAAVGNTMESYDNDQHQYIHSLKLNKLFRHGIASPRVSKWKKKKLSKMVRESKRIVTAESNRVIKKENYDSETDVEGKGKMSDCPLNVQCKSELVYKYEDEWSNHTVTDNPGNDRSFDDQLFSTNCSVKSGCIERDGEFVNISKSISTKEEYRVDREQCYDTNCSVKSGCIENDEELVEISNSNETISGDPVDKERGGSANFRVKNRSRQPNGMDNISTVGDAIDDSGEMNEHYNGTNCSIKSGCIEPLAKKIKRITSCGGSVRSGIVKSEHLSSGRSDVACKGRSEDSRESSVSFKPDFSGFWKQPLYVLLSSYPSNSKEVFGCNRQYCEILSEDPTRTLIETWVETSASSFKSRRGDYGEREDRQMLSQVKRQAKMRKDGYKCF